MSLYVGGLILTAIIMNGFQNLSKQLRLQPFYYRQWIDHMLSIGFQGDQLTCVVIYICIKSFLFFFLIFVWGGGYIVHDIDLTAPNCYTSYQFFCQFHWSYYYFDGVGYVNL